MPEVQFLFLGLEVSADKKKYKLNWLEPMKMVMVVKR